MVDGQFRDISYLKLLQQNETDEWKCGNLGVSLGCRGSKKRSTPSFMRTVSVTRRVGVSPLIRDKVEMFSLNEPAGL